jgi:ABC-type transport system substrate-binding protein
LARASEWLNKAGFPGGVGLPEIDYYATGDPPGPEIADMIAAHLARIGVKINPRLSDFPTFMERVDQQQAPMFSFAWVSDYPDAENNLALFYGPNESPEINRFNYKNETFDRMYERIRSMPPGPERTQIIESMRDLVIADAPFAGSMARVRHYLANPELKNFKPSEVFQNWYKYLDVE